MTSYHVSPAPDTDNLVHLLSRRHVVEVLDTLTAGPASCPALRSATHARRRPLRSALRVLAAHGHITHEPAGIWDDHLPGQRHYTLTPRGVSLAQRLMRLDEWTALYRHANNTPAALYPHAVQTKIDTEDRSPPTVVPPLAARTTAETPNYPAGRADGPPHAATRPETPASSDRVTSQKVMDHQFAVADAF